MKEMDILRKPSASVQVSNKEISLVQRKIFNSFIFKARHYINQDSSAFQFSISISELRNSIKFNSHNLKFLKEEIKALRSLEVEYNILGKDSKVEWGVMGLIGSASIKDSSTGSVITYTLPHQLLNALKDPDNLYAKIDMQIIKGLKSKYTIALYELCQDYINVRKLPYMSIKTFRELMGIKETLYKDFSNLKKRVINVCEKEINESETIPFTIKYELKKEGTRVVGIYIYISLKKHVQVQLPIEDNKPIVTNNIVDVEVLDDKPLTKQDFINYVRTNYYHKPIILFFDRIVKREVILSIKEVKGNLLLYDFMGSKWQCTGYRAKEIYDYLFKNQEQLFPYDKNIDIHDIYELMEKKSEEEF